MKRQERRLAFVALLAAVVLIALGLATPGQGRDFLVPLVLCLFFLVRSLSLPALPSALRPALLRIRAEARSPPSRA